MSDVSIWGGTGSGGAGITVPVGIAQGGTGATDAATARTDLSVPSIAEVAAADALKADITSPTGSLVVPVGTTAERDASPAVGAIRRNTTLNVWEGWDGTAWTQLGTGSSGGGGTGTAGAINGIFWENSQVVTDDYTITTAKNAGTFGPITIADDKIVLIPDGSEWSIV